MQGASVWLAVCLPVFMHLKTHADTRPYKPIAKGLFVISALGSLRSVTARASGSTHKHASRRSHANTTRCRLSGSRNAAVSSPRLEESTDQNSRIDSRDFNFLWDSCFEAVLDLCVQIRQRHPTDSSTLPKGTAGRALAYVTPSPTSRPTDPMPWAQELPFTPPPPSAGTAARRAARAGEKSPACGLEPRLEPRRPLPRFHTLRDPVSGVATAASARSTTECHLPR